MDSLAREAKTVGNKLFSNKQVVDSLWQELSYQFYPERADFTDKRNHGEEYTDHLYSSYPVLARRELGNLLSSNLRPESKKWFSLHVANMELDERSEERRYLEYLSQIQWRAMYDPKSGLVKATKQGDHDYVTFGNAVIYVTPNSNIDGLLYRNYHLRDCAWSEGANGTVDEMHRKWMPTAKQLKQMFGDKVSKQVNEACEKDPHKEIECRHIIMPERLYHHRKLNGETAPYTSMMIECESETTLEEIPIDWFPYAVPRWMTVSGSQYGRSMATSVALPDGRTTQVVTRTLREAAEKYVDPPMIAIADAIRGDMPTYAGGVTIADMEYDERLGEVLRPITQQSGNMPVGFEVAQALREDIRAAFMLDKINLPDPTNTDMTAFEVRRRIEEHIRGASPIFEPIEKDYSNPLCDITFNILQKYNGFPMEQMPKSLQGSDIKFTFRSPLSDMTDEAEASVFVDVVQRILMPVAQVDPSQMENVDLTTATRDAMRKAGWQEKWFKPEEEVAKKKAEMEQMAKAQQAAELAQQAGAGVAQGAGAVQALQNAGGNT